MVVYVGFRRGNWAYRTVAPFLPFKSDVVRKVLCAMVHDSWMQCALVFTTACSQNQGCAFCPHSEAKANLPKVKKRKYHLLTIRLDDEADGVVTGVDSDFDKADAWVLIRLADITDRQAAAFWQSRSVGDKTYNTTGLLYNFMPWWVRLGDTVGVKADNDITRARGFFCSEMITAFLQQHKPYAQLGLVPCETTPQQLYDALSEVSHAQYCLTGCDASGTAIEALIVPVV